MNPYIDALTLPSILDAGGDRTITFAFGGTNWTAGEMAAFLAVFAAYEAVIDIDFVEADAATAEFVEWKVASSTGLRQFDGWTGWHDTPGELIEPTGQSFGFYVSAVLSPPVASETSYWLIPHEIGHALGLSHPHGSPYEHVGTQPFPGVTLGDGTDPGDYGLNHPAYSVMAYRGDVSVRPVGPMAFDIAALQAMYGANLTTGAGNDAYALLSGAYRCIWDAGGIDVLNGTAGNDIIDLRPASLVGAPGGGGYLSYRTSGGAVGGMTIAAGVTIENATGGGGVDILYGNAAGNSLVGAALNDTLYGFGGSDVINGGGGSDTFYFGNDTDADRGICGGGDILRQFDSGEDKIDLRLHNAKSVWVTASGSNWTVNASTDADSAAEITLTVIGVKPLLSDILW